MSERRVHNHGPEEGEGLACRESLIGDCLRGGYDELVSLISRVHAYGGLSHTPFCAKFALSQDNPTGAWDAETAFPCDCGVEAIFDHMRHPQRDTP